MAKINTSAIENFDSMTAEEKVQALLGMEIPEDRDMSKYILKTSFDKASSDAAEWKRKYNEKLTDEEKAKAEEEEKRTDMERKYNELLRKNNISERKAQYIALGYSEDLATSTATAMIDGDQETVMQNMKAFQEKLVSDAKASAMMGMAKPQGFSGNATPTITKEQFRKMSYSEIVKLKNENPELYKQLKG